MDKQICIHSTLYRIQGDSHKCPHITKSKILRSTHYLHQQLFPTSKTLDRPISYCPIQREPTINALSNYVTLFIANHPVNILLREKSLSQEKGVYLELDKR